MLQKRSSMTLLWALRLVWLISVFSLNDVALGSNAACNFRGYCNGIQYDKREAVCCENKLYQGGGLSCCDNFTFNPAEATCCKGNVTPGLSKMVSDCCELVAYNQLNEICCQSNIIVKPVPNAKCCGAVAFDEDNQLCCGPNNNKTILARISTHHECCGHKQFDTKTECCCSMNDGIHVQHITSSCCVEDPVVLQMQEHQLKSKCTETQTSLCGSTCYDPNEFHCCERSRCSPGLGRCDSAPTVYNPRTQVCCDGCVSECKDGINQCYRQTPFDKVQHGVIYCNNNLCKDREDGEECSESSIHDYPLKGTICCCQFHGSPGHHCCGTEIYQPHIEICCNGKRYSKVENSHCCGIHIYNIKDPHVMCCSGTLYKLESLGMQRQNVQCCGSILQKPENQDVCCSSEDKELLYAKQKDFKCCGHHYYNTSLWSCCAGKLSPRHQPGQPQAECTFPTVNNLNGTYLCRQMKIGIVESVSLQSIAFSSVLEIHGTNSTVKPLPSPHILKIPNYCNLPKLIHGKAYVFDKVNVFTDFNHDSPLQLLYFIISKCNRC